MQHESNEQPQNKNQLEDVKDKETEVLQNNVLLPESSIRPTFEKSEPTLLDSSRPKSPNEEQTSSNKYDKVFNSNQSSPEKSKNENQSSINSKKTWNKNDIENDKRLLISKSSTFEKTEYIQPIEWSYMDDSNFIIIENESIKWFQSLNTKELFQWSKSIRNCNISSVFSSNNIDNLYNIGSWSTLEYMVESTFFYDQTWKMEMTLHVWELEKYLFRWRSICGDGNCFYRAIIFSFLENIILTKNNLLLKEFIIAFKTKMHTSYPNVNYKPYIIKEVAKWDTNWIIQILYLIVEAMEDERNQASQIKCYEILIKSFLFCKQFDYGMVYFFRFLLFEYIKNNENKAYTPEFSVKIGNLLPSEYETEKGEFLFDKFYEEHLLKMFTDAEKITIYWTPFVLKCDWNVLMYEFDHADSVSVREFKCGIPGKHIIEVLFRKTHYDVLYNKQYFNEYSKEFCYFVNWKENCRVINSNDWNELRKNKNVKQMSLTSAMMSDSKMNENNHNLPNNNGGTDKNININPNELPSNATVDMTSSTDPQIYKDDIWKCNSCQSDWFEFNIFNQCIKCLRNEIQNQIFALYLIYLNDANEEFQSSHYAFSAYFNNFFSKKQIIISNNHVHVQEICSLTSIQLMDIINSIKASICIICQNNIKSKEFFRLPCKCVLCSEKCFRQYFEIFLVKDYKLLKQNNMINSAFKECLCGYAFSFTDYTNFYKVFSDNSTETFKKYLKEAVWHNWKEKCMFCLMVYNNDNTFYKAVLKDVKLKTVFDIKEFTHIMCLNCKWREKDNKDIGCALCGLSHRLVKIKKITDSDDTDCLVF